uniref:Uncharacterized protein n=1 Tax=viral metagenome TaxID=1070528 RepID=A0A6C0IBG6_9ZZZZ
MKSKVLFISTWINHPECIPVQRDLIKKFCKEDTDFLAVLDGKTEECFTNNCNKNIREEMIDTCKANNINYIEVPPDFHFEEKRKKLFPEFLSAMASPHLYRHKNPSSRTAVANQVGYNTFMTNYSNYRYLVMLQSDIFPFQPFSVIDMLDGNSLLYRNDFRKSDDKQYSIYYAWDGFLMFDFKADPSIDTSLWKTFSFDDQIQKGYIYTDTGGGSWYILEKLQKKIPVNWKPSLQWLINDPLLETFPESIKAFIITDIRNENNNIYAEIYHDNFLHLRGGGNWEVLYHIPNVTALQTERYNRFLSTARALLD